MKKIIIGFSYRKDFNLFSSLIRFCTNSQVSHVYVKIPYPEFNQVLVFQASGLEVNYENYNLFLAKEQVVEEYEIEISDEQDQVSQLFRLTEAGKPYSMKELFGFIWLLILRKVGLNVSNPFAAGNQAYVCVDIGADQIGYSKTVLPTELASGLTGPGESGNLTPEDLRQWVAANPKAKLVK